MQLMPRTASKIKKDHRAEIWSQASTIYFRFKSRVRQKLLKELVENPIRKIKF